jgi:hypothetical protein
MSKLLTLINGLKAQASKEMLTPSQHTALAEVEKRWKFPDRVNLCGPPGSGKTFLGWVIARQLNAQFYASPRILAQEQSPYPTRAVIDNAPSEEKESRRLLAELQLRQFRNTLLITTRPVSMGLPVITLPSPATADIKTVYENLSKLQFVSPQLISEGNLWGLLYSVL